jgi:hypothetical protein
MEPIRVDLVALRRPVEYQFPNEKWFRVEPFRGPGKALLARWKEDPGNGELLMDLLRMAVPTATDADFDELSVDEDIPRIIAAADGKAALVEIALKNGVSGVALKVPPPPKSSPPSTPTTPSPTPSSERRAPTAARGKNSTKRTGTTRSSLSTP